MNLPLRIQYEPGTEPVISVDGAFGAPGLNLSHWPGNATPRELKHDLSTGIALAFARLPISRRAELSRDCVAVANNHFDTDGVCAIFAVVHPELALERERLLLDVAAAGDFFHMPSERALIVELIVDGLVDAERSPWRDRFAGLSDRERTELVLCELMPRFATILDGGVEPYRDLWASALESTRADLRDIAGAARDEVTHLDLCVWTAPANRASSRTPSPNAPSPNAPSPTAPSPNAPSPNAPSPNAPSPGAPSPNARTTNTGSENAPPETAPSESAPSPNARSASTLPNPAHFDPGRHALFGSTRADRVLVVGPKDEGATYRFLLSTLSWFELVSRKMQPRPDLAALCARLNEIEESDPSSSCAWRAQATQSPSPELWFGRVEHEMFAEHAPVLEPSRLPPATVRRAIADALRASWTFPDE